MRAGGLFGVVDNMMSVVDPTLRTGMGWPPPRRLPLALETLQRRGMQIATAELKEEDSYETQREGICSDVWEAATS